MRACVRACLRACVRACVRACSLKFGLAVFYFLIEKGEERKKKKKKKKAEVGRGDTLTSSQKDWVEFYGCIKYVSNDQSLYWQSLEILSLCLRETENSNSSSKTLFYNYCSLGSVNNPSNN